MPAWEQEPARGAPVEEEAAWGALLPAVRQVSVAVPIVATRSLMSEAFPAYNSNVPNAEPA